MKLCCSLNFVICAVVLISSTAFGAEIYVGGSFNYAHDDLKKISLHPRIIRHRTDKVYTPDMYYCYVEKSAMRCNDYKGRPINGTIVRFYEDKISYELYQNGYQNGVTKTFNLSGILLSQSEYRKGIKNGKEYIYFMNGRLHFLHNYKDGMLDGRVEQYDVNGALIGKMTYKKGWFKDGYCKNEKSGYSMHERLHESKYNEIIPCGEQIIED